MLPNMKHPHEGKKHNLDKRDRVSNQPECKPFPFFVPLDSIECASPTIGQPGVSHFRHIWVIIWPESAPPWIFARVDPKTWGGGAQNSIGASTTIALLAGISCAFERPPFRFRFEGSLSSGPIGIKTKQLRIQWQQRVAISWHSLACAPPGGCL